MIRVSDGRLDLHALETGEEIQVRTGVNVAWVRAGDRAGGVHARVRPTGRGVVWGEEDGWRNRWLNLAALQPSRAYLLKAHRADPRDKSSVVIHFRDITAAQGATPIGHRG